MSKIIDPTSLSASELQGIYKGTLDPDMIVNSSKEKDETPMLTIRSLRAIPKSQRVARKAIKGKRVDDKLHCIHCGKLRSMHLAAGVIDKEGALNIIHLNTRRYKNALKTRMQNIPLQVLASCPNCLGTTYYAVTTNYKLAVLN
jgi:hypothetical protein